jgi:hypothetical protein
VTNPRGSECSCSLCGVTFTGIGLFDAHQDVDYRREPVIICCPPVALGLAQDARGSWGTPAGLASRHFHATRLAAACSARASGNSELEVPQ